MAIFYWKGGASVATQAATLQVTAADAATTYTVTAGDASAAVTGNASGANETATAIAAAWEALTHPHAAAVSANATADTITFAAVVPGVPFVITADVDAGNGTLGSVTETVANAGPASAQAVANYVDGNGVVATALPTGSDTVVIRDYSGNITYDLDALTGNGTTIEVEQSFTGRLGLATTEFARDANGGNATSAAREYRLDYLKGPFASVTIGKHTGTGSPTGSPRCKVHTTYTSDGTVNVVNTASSASESFRTPVRILSDSANIDVFVESAPGGVGIATDRADETATVGDIKVAGSNATVVIGAGTTFTNYEQSNGAGSILGAAGNVTEIATTGGSLDISGDFLVTDIDINGGTVTDRHVKTGGNLATTVTVRAGSYDLTASDAPRAIGTLTRTGGSVSLNPNVTIATQSLGRGTVS